MLILFVLILIEFILIRHINPLITVNLEVDSYLYLSYLTISYLVLVALPLYFYIRITKTNLIIFFRLSKDAKYFLIFLGGLLIMIFSLIVFIHFSIPGSSIKIIGNISPFKHSDLLAHGLKTGDKDLVLRFLIPESIHVLIFAPLFEEIFFTGIVYSKLRTHIKMIPALLFSSYIFTVFHTGIFNIINMLALAYFSLQLLSFLLFHYTKSLWPSLVYHLSRNFARLLFFVLMNLS